MKERKLSSKEEKIAQDLPDKEFKKRYGKDWKSVKIATATKMANKNEGTCGYTQTIGGQTLNTPGGTEDNLNKIRSFIREYINELVSISKEDPEATKKAAELDADGVDVKIETKGKDMDGDGDIDSDDYLAARDVAIKKAIKKSNR